MTEALLVVVIVLLVAALGVLVVLLRRSGARLSPIEPRFETLERGQERTERAVRDEIGRNREEAARTGKQLREEVNVSLKGASDSITQQLAKLTESNERKIEALRTTIDARLKQIQDDNARKLDQMRETVNEKLQGVLEKRLGESFKQVSERLEQVHKGLGEMQTLASGVGDLKKVLTNVKTRGTWGEIQLGNLLEQILTPDQYDTNVPTKASSNDRVEFAIKLPGRDGEGPEAVWLPIDAKFPQEDYQRLLDAQEAGDAESADQAVRQLERRVKDSAKDIRDKYLDPPNTTDFGIMFLPTEGLYAEVLRCTGLVERLQGEFRVVVAGPTTLAALLNSLQMGFQTLAIQKRSSEVWALLAAVKAEFGKFGDILDAVHKRLGTATRTIEEATRKTRTIERRLRDVQEIPAPDAPPLLPPDDEA
jgi:DNA recombination protein RmuC